MYRARKELYKNNIGGSIMGIFEEDKKENQEEELFLHSLNEIRSMEVIDINRGEKVGFIKDLVIDIENSKIISLILPGISRGWFSKEEDIEIPWNKVKKAGVEVILIDSSEFSEDNTFNNS